MPNAHASSTSAENESLRDQASNILEEARMVLPGIQALFGFQLIAVFNQRFVELDSPLQELHIVALVLTIVAVGLLMAPAAYHRIAERHQVSEYFVRMASRMIAWGMFPLAAGLSIDLYVVVQAVLEKQAVSLSLSILCFMFYLVLWFVFPWRRR